MPVESEEYAALRIAHDFYMRQSAITARAQRQARKIWRQLDPENFDRSWERLGPAMNTVLTNAQVLAASGAEAYIDEIVKTSGLDSDWAGEINPKAFGGITTEGWRNADLLQQPIIGNKMRIKAGMSTRDAVAAGGKQIDRIISTQVFDSGRAGVSVGNAANRTVTGYTRVVSGKACGNCAVLAGTGFTIRGAYFDVRKAFARHPNCKCQMIPSTKTLSVQQFSSSREYFDSIKDPKEQDRIFTKGGAEAIRNGADIARVVNARARKIGRYSMPGMKNSPVYREDFTGRDLEATYVGFDGRRNFRAPRLTPNGIMQVAKSRDDMLRLLKKYGYIL